MKGYVEITPDEDIIERIRTLCNTAQEFINEFEYKPNTTKTYRKKYYIFGDWVQTGYKIDKYVTEMPYGVCYDPMIHMYDGGDFGDFELNKSHLCLTNYLKNSYKIVELYDNNEKILLDDELASIYNNYKKVKND